MKSENLREWVSASVLLGLILGSVAGFDYCTVPCRTRTQTLKHTMCLYPKQTPGSLCKSYEDIRKLKDDDKELLVKLHNQLRNKVAEGKESRGSPGPQPPAANMMELVWDNELETIARRWALQCDYKHDKCRQTKSQEVVGQNLAISYDSVGFKNDLEKMVTEWYDEVELAPSRVVQSFSSSAGSGAIGHYTQLIWGETSRIGCARVFFDYSDWGMTEYLVCNYAQGGNMNSAPIYEVGKHCSACSRGLKCSLKYPGLCAPGAPGAEGGVTSGEDNTGSGEPGTEDTEAPDLVVSTVTPIRPRIDEEGVSSEEDTHSSAGTGTRAVAGELWGTTLSTILTILVVKFF